ncbi:LAME_0F17392g1_1 [Lachancea meyersii CBS 8951]|uniref:LAME_0F17392g1_1 n=1 Tax=Lachancea meyersii CBS 8951 TaxID=1266667 RepID=A0A1G4JZU8_9SACH|nr:LAME_0F17392g1_1 [Lachancea meyersii CBS 8951]
MRLLSVFVVFLGAVAYATSLDRAKSYILTLEEDQEAWKGKLDDLKSLVKQTGGKITHEYSLVKGFSMEIPSSHSTDVLERLEKFAQKLKFKLNIEQDQEVHAMSGPNGPVH